MAIGGRPKEEGGHRPLKISIDKFVSEGLEKVGNKSQFLEKLARPVLEKLDPGEASFFLWRIDVYISQGIIQATKKGDFKQVNALSWLANSLEDARKLCGVPPSNFKFSQEALTVQDKLISDYFKDIDLIRRKNLHDSAKAMALARSLIMKLPPHMKKDLELPLKVAWESFSKRYNERLPKDSIEERYWRPLVGAVEVDLLIDKISTLLHESLKINQL